MSKRRLSEFFHNLPNLDIGGADYAVLCELARRENEETGLCCPSVETLATFTHFNARTVQRSIHSLARKGILTIKIRRDDKNRMTSHSFRFNLINPKPPKDDPYPVKLSPLKGGKLSPSRGDRMSPSSPDNLSPSSALTKCHPNNTTRSLNNPNVNNQTQNNTTPNPIQPHSPRAHAKGGALMGYVVEGSVEGASPEKETDGSECDLPMTAMMDTKRPPQGYPDEDKFNAFAKTLVLNHDYENTILQAAKYVFEQMCKQGFADAAGNYFKNWRKYARSSIAKLVDDAHRHIIKWDDRLVNIKDVTPAEIGQWRPQSASESQSEPAEQPQKPLPPRPKEHKPDPKPHPPARPKQPMEIQTAVEPPPPKRSTEEIIRADPTTFRSMIVARLKAEREEAARRKRVLSVSSGHAEGVYYSGK